MLLQAQIDIVNSSELLVWMEFRAVHICAGELQEGPAGSFGTFLDSSIEPLLQACESNSQALRSSGNPEDVGGRPNAPQIFLLNCMLAIWSPLSLHRSCSQHVAQLRQRIDEQVQLCVLADVKLRLI